MDNRMTITRKLKWEEKQLYGRSQNNAIRTHHIKARIDMTQQNSNCRLCGDRNETINHIISECSKLAQKKYKTRHDEWARRSIGNSARNLIRLYERMLHAQPSICPRK